MAREHIDHDTSVHGYNPLIHSVYVLPQTTNKVCVPSLSISNLYLTLYLFWRKVVIPYVELVPNFCLLQGVASLLSLCLSCARRNITLRNFPLNETEQLPVSLIKELSRLKMSDFHINPAHITGEDHAEQVFPATCLVDDSKTHLCITLSGKACFF